MLILVHSPWVQLRLPSYRPLQALFYLQSCTEYPVVPSVLGKKIASCRSLAEQFRAVGDELSCRLLFDMYLSLIVYL